MNRWGIVVNVDRHAERQAGYAEIRGSATQARILVVSVNVCPELVPGGALSTGAHGYVTKSDASKRTRARSDLR